MNLRKRLKSFKRTLEVKSKRQKNKLSECREIIDNLKSDDLINLSLYIKDYSKNVNKVSEESCNKRIMLYSVPKLNVLISFNTKYNNQSYFTVKWKNDKKENVEVGITSVHIYHNSEKSDDIIFTTLYNVYNENGDLSKAEKIHTLKFNFSNDEVVRINKNTDIEQSFSSVGYVLLVILSKYIEEKGEIVDIDDFKLFFSEYSQEKKKELDEKFNFDNVINLLTTDSIEDEKLMSLNYL